jgi:NarL family two-component system sensor histidine kinase LiaS
VDVHLQVPDTLDINAANEALLYRVANEAVRNTLAHAEATEVTIRVTVDHEQAVELEVIDNGVGMRPERSIGTDGSHLGLRLLSELVEEADGQFDVRSGVGGTTVATRVPRR